MDVFDAAERYHKENKPVIILAGKEYGSGSSRDWAAKGPWMLVTICIHLSTYKDLDTDKSAFSEGNSVLRNFLRFCPEN